MLGDASPDAYNFIAQHNGIANPDVIYAGQQIEIPYLLANQPQNQTLVVENPIVPGVQSNSEVINGFEVSGEFLQVFREGNFGKPTSGVITHSSGVKFQYFDKPGLGQLSIVQSEHGTFPLYGGIRSYYVNVAQGLNGALGAPTSGEEPTGNGQLRQNFENGYILWKDGVAQGFNLDGSSLFPTPAAPLQESSGAPLTYQGAITETVGTDYFLARPEFYTTGNIFAQSGYGSSLVNSMGSTEGNCTWYAHGRVLEMGGDPSALRSMNGNANEWHTQLSNGARVIESGELPQPGDIAQWTRNGQNHVAVVEEVYQAGDGQWRIKISESHYYGGNNGILHSVKDYSADNPDRFIRVPGVNTEPAVIEAPIDVVESQPPTITNGAPSDNTETTAVETFQTFIERSTSTLVNIFSDLQETVSSSVINQPSTQEIGFSLITQNNESLVSVYELLDDASQGNYSHPTIPENDFLTKKFSDIAENRGQWFGARRDFSYRDYLQLKLRHREQINLINKAENELVEQGLSDIHEKFNNSTVSGAKDLAQEITDKFNTYAKYKEERYQEYNFSFTDAFLSGDNWAYALEETRVDLGNLITGAGKAGGKLVLAFLKVGQLFDELMDRVEQSTSGVSYAVYGASFATSFAVVHTELLEQTNDLVDAATKGDFQKVFETASKAASTYGKITEKLGSVVPEGIETPLELIEIGMKIKEFSDLTVLANHSSFAEVSNEFDKGYIAAAIVSSVLDISATLTNYISSNLAESGVKSAEVVENFTEKFDSVRSLLFDALDFTYKDRVTDDFELLTLANRREQETVQKLADTVDFSVERIGSFVLSNYPEDIVVRQDGETELNLDSIP
ncbi:CHAP domain-containing protein [Oscillatoria sp. FACHB-1407]|nr:CHAP domain-containing protein [Oscillatoria sp. FACHB-1407]